MKRTGLGVRRWVAMAGAWLFAVLGVVGGCRGQMPELDRGMPGTEFAKLTFQEAREEAYKKKRLLMVYLYDNKDTDTTEMERRTWRNPTLAAYCLWHCVTVRYERRDREFGGAIRCTAVRAMRGLNNHPGKMPSVYVMRDAVAPTERNCPGLAAKQGRQPRRRLRRAPRARAPRSFFVFSVHDSWADELSVVIPERRIVRRRPPCPLSCCYGDGPSLVRLPRLWQGFCAA